MPTFNLYSKQVHQLSCRSFTHIALHKLSLYSKENYEHSIRVAFYARIFSEYLEHTESDVLFIYQSALIHDIGKLKTPLDILHKPGRLTYKEMNTLKEHAQDTYMLLKEIPQLKLHALIGSLHHERWDGKGYPYGLKGRQIPHISQIIAISDTWDALISDRVYREGMSIDVALNLLQNEKNQGQFDPRLVNRFINFIVTLTSEL